ncbi:uncharacterized protein SPPG_03305 [Spizellomyces punctatus DAOM BR117]|uniref:Outer spore wall protein RRT8 n=1 Tax=Spizellomyces punctatus (strain DAOM BR117) TaxID=645134 RepID=A0A0L0HK71_SPIPD|nr:uncharacterized protein SPPG_03305 [Spizellomyces punctatus DAOM BR117]KND01507.1 hypothetical protein SPPG_03305 [Spizellomyces punctatus DAOM BR117]|eukprot:XP_016609546.1 hypothetical protein SPPG_03305 [Spizellomyces punctatus DAOM BR117]
MPFNELRETTAIMRKRMGEFKSDPSGFTREIGNEMVEQISSVCTASKGAYVYPIKGIGYFFSHSDLYKPIGGAVAQATLTSLAITIAMFFITFVPQAAFLSLFATPFLGIPGAVVLVLVESWLVVSLVVKALFLEPLLDDLFNRTLVHCGQAALVARNPKKQSRIAKAAKRTMDRFSPAAIARYLLTLPLNFIPVIGPLVFFILNGRRTGQAFHAQYFQLKGWTSDQVHSFIESQKGAYTAFGTLALLLQLIPFLGVVFTATSTVGAALWACDIEKSAPEIVKDSQRNSTPVLKEQ